jgi:hypothetical protein
MNFAFHKKGNKMKKLFFIAAALLMSVVAQAENLYFYGNIGNLCTLSNATNGRFVQVGPRVLDAFQQGTPAGITVSNNAAGTYKISISQPSGWLTAPAAVSSTGFQLMPRVAGPNASSGFAPSGSKISTILNSSGTDVVTVGLLFEDFAIASLPVGEYSVAVNVICEPR